MSQEEMSLDTSNYFSGEFSLLIGHYMDMSCFQANDSFSLLVPETGKRDSFLTRLQSSKL